MGVEYASVEGAICWVRTWQGVIATREKRKGKNMLNKKILVLIAAAALAACFALVGCGGSQAPSSSAAASAEASPAASESAASESAASASVAAESAAAEASSAAAAASTAAAEASAAAPATAPAAAPSGTAAAADSYIGDQAALDIALGDAGFAAADVTELEVELDYDDAVVHYDVNFKQGGMEYDYDIDATTGSILSSSSEVDD